MRSLGIFVFVIIFSLPLVGQSWRQVDDRFVPQLGKRNINPDRYITVHVADAEIKDILWGAPEELEFDSKSDRPTLINVMMADGTMDEFSIVRYHMMEPGLASRYDDIRTFHGLSTTNAARRIRINYTVHGLRATITDESGQTYIDHLQRKDKNHKIIYRRSDFSANEDWTCDFEEVTAGNKKEITNDSRSGDCVFRSYRFSMTATGEYSNYHGAISAAQSNLVLSAMVTTIDRVNDVFEQDLTMRLILISNVDDVFYYNASTDPFAGDNAQIMINQNQTNTNNVIGSANYDLGHIVSTGGSGLAGLGVLCINNQKARGVTGIGTPEGDPFDIDYVAHEIGHQLGGNHTQNNSCNRSSAAAMEPGSASTIMGYAGICPPNIQNNSDAYFHAHSVGEMNATLTGTSCNQVISLSNSSPVVDPLVNKSIPHSTPFVLGAEAMDPDGDVLTYNWEQMDNEVGATMPPAGTNTQGPMFRSKFATLDSKRYFPNISAVAAGTNDTWEVLPTVDRNMDFRVTVRDNNFAPGCTDEQDISLDVEGSAGPFLVTSQNTSTTWQESEDVTITWDVANTDIAPVSCSEVDILLSYDGGLTYPVVLASATLNDGTTIISVPSGVSNTARVMVRCSDNVFYNINDTNITIQAGSPSFVIDTDPLYSPACNNQSVSFTIESSSFDGFTGSIALSISNLPAGASSVIATNPLPIGSNTVVTLDNMDGLLGNYTINITGTSSGTTKEAVYDLILQEAPLSPSLIAPEDNANGVLFQPNLSWNSVSGAIDYVYEVSTLANGGNVIVSGSTAATTVTLPAELSVSTTYFWRVRTNSICGLSPWSNDRTFETVTCIVKTASDLPIDISASGTPTITSMLNFKDKGIVTDLNIIDLVGTHTYVSDLTFTLIAPDDTEVDFLVKKCGNQNDFDINFDDEVNATISCPLTGGNTYRPDNSLTAFDTKQFQGDWTLSVFDDFNADGGSLDSWGVEICFDDYCDLTVNNNAYVDSYGTLLSALGCAVDGDTIYLESVLTGSSINIGSGTIVINESIVIIAKSSDAINIASEGDAPTFIINAGKNVSLIGFQIENTDSSVGVIQNNGNLILKDINIISNTGVNAVVNQNNGLLTIEGDCRLEKE